MVVIDEAAKQRDEPPPHGRIGMSTAWRITDGVPGRMMEYRKRALHPGAAIGVHPIDHERSLCRRLRRGRGRLRRQDREAQARHDRLSLRWRTGRYPPDRQGAARPHHQLSAREGSPAMISRRTLLAASATLAFTPGTAVSRTVSKGEVAETMKRATRFMVEKLAYRGGYLWSYLPDRSRVWGELEAYKTMVWVQPPGTATMGHLYLDAYSATGDDYYYQAAAKAAEALIAGQLPKGGWNYFIDFGGPASTKRWYDTIGRNAWRMEEFQHHWGNATFDDQGTGEAIRLLIRIYAEKRERRFKAGLDKAIGFILASQLPNGGWPQRWPRVPAGGLHGHPDYTASSPSTTASSTTISMCC
ncbi:pectic acid lyase domain-containing protein [Ditylenchus destructor]|uniref:Pectic acid lyase domain-containing protein n=1 Tax=Ditylenchus destructor TaxID=166010 RepID=A0AAD4QUV7_9BILA|nr:pectic acid lyase domain-containing protein [Ditylenchus destructor]